MKNAPDMLGRFCVWGANEATGVAPAVNEDDL